MSALALAPIAAAIPSLARAEDDLGVAPDIGGTGRAGGTPSGPSAASRATLTPPLPLSTQLELSGGFRVVRAHGVHYGAMPFVIEGEGERFQLDVLRPDAAGPSGVYETSSFSVFVHDHGSAATMPARERGARALGAALERRIRGGAALPVLASFSERRAAHPTGGYAIDFEPSQPSAPSVRS